MHMHILAHAPPSRRHAVMQTYIHWHTPIHYTLIHTYIRTYVHTDRQTDRQTETNTPIYIHACMNYMHTCMHAYIHSCAYANVHCIASQHTPLRYFACIAYTRTFRNIGCCAPGSADCIDRKLPSRKEESVHMTIQACSCSVEPYVGIVSCHLQTCAYQPQPS